MADGVTHVPSGKNIATDEVTRNATTEHQQVFKIGLGAEGAFDTLVDAGPQSSANSIPVVLPTDLADIPIKHQASSASVSAVNDSATDGEVLAANSARKGAIFYNNSTSAMFLKFGGAASNSDFTVKLASYDTWVLPLPIYTGSIHGIWESDTAGKLMVTELT